MATKRVSSTALFITGLLVLAMVSVGGIAAQEKSSQNAQDALADVSTAFTYQGELRDGGALADGVYDFRFALYDAVRDGAQVGSEVAVDGVTVSGGLFTVALDFGPVFDGTALWLEVGVREAGGGGVYTTLDPRQGLTAAPYALGLLPGAVMSGTVPSGSGVLNLSSSEYGLVVRSALEDGVYVFSAAEDGLRVRRAGDDGVQVSSAADSGLYVGHADGDGVFVCSTGDVTECSSSENSNNGVEIGNAENNGVAVYSADWSGVLVASVDGDGLSVADAGDDGVEIQSASDDGVAVIAAGDDGVYANTTRGSGEWGVRTPDKISASNLTFSSLTLVAQVAGPEPLSPGDLVAATGVTEPLPGSTIPMALVRPADAQSLNGIVGVVDGRMTLSMPSAPAEIARENPERDMPPGDEPPEFHSASGPANAGDYIALTVFGVAQVNVSAAEGIQPGQRLTSSEVAGQARPLRTKTLNGMVVTEGAPVIGIALAGSEPGRDSIPVFVTLR